MINLFKKTPAKKEVVALKEQPNVITVEMVHNEFFTASEEILKQAQNILLQSKASKAKRLLSFGFHNSKDVIESQDFTKKKIIADVITKYQASHPFNKVITNEAVSKICDKYNLLRGEIHRFKGFVPEKNLKEMENFNCPEGYQIYSGDYGQILLGRYKTRQVAEEAFEEFERQGKFPEPITLPYYKMRICAPVKDMEVRQSDQIKDRVIVPDPIILWPIENDCWLIVTAWGDEASDPDVVNQIFN